MKQKELYKIYDKMFSMIPDLEKKIREKYEKAGYTVYCVFLAVSNEESESYFLELEIGGNAEKYKHIRDIYTLEEIQKKFM